MKVNLLEIIDPQDGNDLTINTIKRGGIDDPIILTFQFCVERSHFIELQRAGEECKSNLYSAIQDLLDDPNPYTLFDQYGP